MALDDKTKAVMAVFFSFCLLLILALGTPEIRLSLIDEEKIVFQWGSTTVTTGDMLIGFMLLGCAVTIGLFVNEVYIELKRHKR